MAHDGLCGAECVCFFAHAVGCRGGRLPQEGDVFLRAIAWHKTRRPHTVLVGSLLVQGAVSNLPAKIPLHQDFRAPCLTRTDFFWSTAFAQDSLPSSTGMAGIFCPVAPWNVFPRRRVEKHRFCTRHIAVNHSDGLSFVVGGAMQSLPAKTPTSTDV